MTVQTTEDTVAALAAACRALRSVCDGAADNDDQGFNRVDAYLGHRLADLPPDKWTPQQAAAAYKMLRSYRGQLRGFGIEYDAIPAPSEEAQAGTGRGWKQLFETAQERVEREQRNRRQAERRYREQHPVRIGARPDDGLIAVAFDYDAVAVAAIKQLSPRGRWQRPCWVFPYTPAAVEALVPFAAAFGKDGAADLLLTLQGMAADMERLGITDPPPPPPLSVVFTKGEVRVKFADFQPDLKDLIKAAGLWWDGEGCFWHGLFTAAAASAIAECASRLDYAFEPEMTAKLLDKIETQERNLATSSALAPTAPIHIPQLRRALRPFQLAGVEYLVRNPCTLLADQMGLGKTCTSLAALIAQNAFPAVVVVPASLKYNWLAEVLKWAPHLNVSIITGRAAWRFRGDEDLFVINYDVLHSHLPDLIRQGLKALIVDEAHMIKNKRARRSEAVRELAKHVDIKYLLTGTPVMNRPSELLVPLEVLGKLDEFGGYWRFISRYCNATPGRFGNDTSGAAHLEELNQKLRATCMIRRTTRDVFTELPPIERVVVQVDIDNGGEYRTAERDLLAYVARMAKADKEFNASIAHLPKEEQERLRNARALDARTKAERAEVLVRIETLKQLCVKGKMKAIREWVDNYLEGTDDKLLIFAHHQEIQRALAALYPTFVQVMGETSAEDRQRAVNRFQNDPQARGAVLSLAAGSVGLTLTEARHVLFVEFGWRPADHDQAEARAYGRANDPHPVTAYYLCGRKTIDETILALLEQKRGVADMVHDGVKSRQPEITTDEILSGLRGRAGVHDNN